MECFEALKGETELGTRLSREDYDRLLKSMRHMMSINPTALLKNVTPAELKLIYCAQEYFKNEGTPVSSAEAAERLGISAPAVSRTVKGLEVKGCLKRRLDDNDRRSIKIEVTEKGRELLEENMKRYIALLDKIFAEFSDSELADMVRLHCKFSAELRKIALAANSGKE
ncbi:MAG: MarR family transcriptional regulator [Oscillospiraceae bacterium]|nr:MarR family transcriptional regulator [Oscillospiraceae bacterium]